MPKKRRLSDLYVVGKEVTFDDGDGEPLTVYVRKLNPVDHESALRCANAARSRALSLKSQPDSDDYQAILSAVITNSYDELLDYLVEDLRQKRRPIVQARVADEEKWSKEHYLQGLYDSRVADADPDDEEAQRVEAEIVKYEAEVDAELKAEVNDFTAELEGRPEEDLREKVLDKIFDVRASIAWLNEYRRCEVWLSVREPDRKARYFHNRAEVDDLPAEVFQRLTDVYVAISVEPTEGKDSAATPPSSPSSEPQESPATDESSGLKSAAA